MSSLPYFRWYPADAKGDERYYSMTDQELGFFHRCLNHAWGNNGLPADLDQLAKLMRISRYYLDSVWPAVGACFYEEGGRLFNKRQEKERARALAVGEANKRAGNANAKKTRSEKNANDSRDRGSDSDSIYDSSSKKKEASKELPWPADFGFEAWFAERDRKHPIPGKPQLAKDYAIDLVYKKFTPDEFNKSHDAWCDYWKTQSGGIPTLAVFIWEGWYRKQPPIREPTRRGGPILSDEQSLRIIEEELRNN